MPPIFPSLVKKDDPKSILDMLALLRKDPSELTPEEQAQVNNYRQTTGGTFKALGDAGTILGSSLQATANIPGQLPDVGQSVLGGAISGFSSSGLLGGIGGALSGLLQSAQSGSAYDALMQPSDRLKGKTISPSLYADGGDVPFGAQDEDKPQEMIDIQTEVGEMLLMPNGEIVEVLAKDKHKDQDKKNITDKVPAGTFVFSSKNKINLKKLTDAQDLIAVYPGKYTEDGNVPMQELRLTDILGDGKMSFAEAAKKIQKAITTTEDYKDIFNDNANSLNIETRIPYLMKLMQLQEHHKQKENPEKFAEGGPVNQEPKSLSKDSLDMYNNWIKDQHIPISNDYDMLGFFRKYGPTKTESGQHFTDEFKLPNHITFSNESRYSNDNTTGGEWIQDKNGKWIFKPSSFNLQQNSFDAIKAHLLNEGAGIDTTAIKKYASGGFIPGEEYDLTQEQINKLKKLGYKIETV